MTAHGGLRAPKPASPSWWTDERIATLRQFYADGVGPSEIARRMGAGTRNVILGKASRLGLVLNASVRATPPKPRPPVTDRAPRPAPAAPLPRLPKKVSAVAARPAPVGELWPEVARRETRAERAFRPPDRDLVALFDLTPRMCRWPFGDAPVLFCGEVTADPANPECVYQHNGDRAPKPGRPLGAPISTITATGGQSTIVAAYLAQHNTGEIGHEIDRPISTIVGKGCTQGLVQASFLSHAYTSNTAGGNGDLERPLKTTLAGGQHAALVAAFLAKYYGAGEPSQGVDEPLHTLTTKPRHGLVTVTLGGEPYVVTDIGMRMLTPRERFSAQGFRPDYTIDHGLLEDGSTVAFTLEQQGRMCGNSVCPGMARALVAANVASRPRVRRAKPLREAPLLVAAE